VKRSQSKRARNKRKRCRESPSGEHDEIVPSNGASSPVRHLINNHEHIPRIINCKEVFYYIIKEVY